MDDPSLAKIEQDLSHQTLADHIIAWDKKQARETWDPDARRLVPNPTGARCPRDPEHGLLTMHGSGHQLICAATRPIVCDHAEPVSR